jgi:hypothetical protein
VKVVKIESNWAYVEGAMFPTSGGNLASGWVNLDKVEWYRIIEEKKGS